MSLGAFAFDLDRCELYRGRHSRSPYRGRGQAPEAAGPEPGQAHRPLRPRQRDQRRLGGRLRSRHRRAGHAPAPQDRGRPEEPALPADRARGSATCSRPTDALPMNPWRFLRRFRRVLTPRFLKRFVPTSLFGRSLLIILLPIVVMQIAVTWGFFEAHWRTVTGQLSESLAGDIAWDVSLYEASPTPRTVAVPGRAGGALPVPLHRPVAERASCLSPTIAPCSRPSTRRSGPRWTTTSPSPSSSTAPATPPTSISA